MRISDWSSDVCSSDLVVVSGRPDTTTETFVVVKAEVGTWRWAGVPFYLRTGKRLAKRRSEIVVQFRPVPHLMFPGAARDMVPNRLVIRLQPDEGISLQMMTKVPGRSEEHTSELQSLMRISYAVFCLKK